MKINIYSDLHLEFGNPTQIPSSGEILILAGDICVTPYALEEFVSSLSYEHILFVLGNHEYYKRFKRSDYLNLTGITTLDRSVVTIDGQRFVGCTLWGGDITPEVESRMNDFRFTDEAYKGLEHYDWLMSEIRPGDVVITHHIPNASLVADCHRASTLQGGYVNSIDPMGAKLWVFGHGHHCVDEVIDGCRYVANTYGYYRYDEAVGFDKDKLVEINC